MRNQHKTTSNNVFPVKSKGRRRMDENLGFSPRDSRRCTIRINVSQRCLSLLFFPLSLFSLLLMCVCNYSIPNNYTILLLNPQYAAGPPRRQRARSRPHPRSPPSAPIAHTPECCVRASLPLTDSVRPRSRGPRGVRGHQESPGVSLAFPLKYVRN